MTRVQCERESKKEAARVRENGHIKRVLANKSRKMSF